MLQCLLSIAANQYTMFSSNNFKVSMNLFSFVQCYPTESGAAGNLAENMPKPEFEACLNQEYDRNVQASRCAGMLSRIRDYGSEDSYQELLEKMLYPNKKSIKEALGNARANALTRLVSDYFEHTEKIAGLCLRLSERINCARALYAPVDALVQVFPDNSQSLSQSQCNWAFDKFLEFNSFNNPFPCSDSQDLNELRFCLIQLKNQLKQRLCKSRTRIPLVRRGTASSVSRLIGAAAGATASTAATMVLSLARLVVAPCLPVRSRLNYTKKVRSYVAQLDAAAKGTYVIYNDLDTIDRNVARLSTAVEGYKLLVRLGLEMGKNGNSIRLVVKELRRNHSNFTDQLDDVEEYLCLCFDTLNKARSLLFQEICSQGIL